MDTTPTIPIPNDTDMALEPSLTIGKQFADATYVKALIGAAFTIVGAIAPHLIPRLDDAFATSITTIVVAVASIIVLQQSRAVPKAQAKETRAAVYAPSTVANLLGQPFIPSPPADGHKDIDAVLTT